MSEDLELQKESESFLKQCLEEEGSDTDYISQASCANQLGVLYKSQELSKDAHEYFYLAH